MCDHILDLDVRLNAPQYSRKHLRPEELVWRAAGKQGTTGDICLYEAARKTALAHKWPADSKAPFKQIGFVIVEFSVRQ